MSGAVAASHLPKGKAAQCCSTDPKSSHRLVSPWRLNRINPCVREASTGEKSYFICLHNGVFYRLSPNVHPSAASTSGCKIQNDKHLQINFLPLETATLPFHAKKQPSPSNNCIRGPAFTPGRRPRLRARPRCRGRPRGRRPRGRQVPRLQELVEEARPRHAGGIQAGTVAGQRGSSPGLREHRACRKRCADICRVLVRRKQRYSESEHVQVIS